MAFGSAAPSTTPVPLGGFTFGQTSAFTGTSSTGFNFGGGLAQPTGLSSPSFGTPNTQEGELTFGSAPSEGFILGAGKTTAPATLNPTPFGGIKTTSLPTASTTGCFCLPFEDHFTSHNHMLKVKLGQVDRQQIKKQESV